MAKQIVHQPGNGRVLQIGDDRATVILDAPATGGAFALVEYVLAPGSGPGQHTHDGHESYWILEGQVIFRLGKDQHELRPGALLHVPPGVVHGFRNETDQPAKLLWLFSPAMALDRMGWLQK